ncbi:alpha-hydroxy-acid oxidizing protein [Myxococcota bacterium]|nr:alpha-hydroxy-acid oxidizing protein [Myxococcota bacterium]
MHDSSLQRRLFLRYLAASPLLAQSVMAETLETVAKSIRPEATSSSLRLLGESLQGRRAPWQIESPEEARSVFDFETVAANRIPPAHFGFLQTGVDGEATLRANREAFGDLYLNPRVLSGSGQIDMGTELFGQRWETPIVLAPAGSQRAFNPEGELATARAAGKQGNLQILSTVSTTSVEDVVTAYGAPVWYQLYPTSNWAIAATLVARAEAAGCPVLVLTVDSLAGEGTKETQARAKSLDSRPCSACHPSPDTYLARKPMFNGVDISAADPALGWGANLDWDFVRQLKANTSMKLVIKGIVTAHDAERCLENGADGIVVSNHGGRAVETGRGTLACLPEVVEAVSGQVPVLVDSGFRRGTDIFKGLALGATAVCIGRPYLWGLGAFGQPGVESVLSLLRNELEVVMRQMGTSSLSEIDSRSVGRHRG